MEVVDRKFRNSHGQGLDEALEKEDVEVEEPPARRGEYGGGLAFRRRWSGRRKKRGEQQGGYCRGSRGGPQARRGRT